MVDEIYDFPEPKKVLQSAADCLEAVANKIATDTRMPIVDVLQALDRGRVHGDSTVWHDYDARIIEAAATALENSLENPQPVEPLADHLDAIAKDAQCHRGITRLDALKVMIAGPPSNGSSGKAAVHGLLDIWRKGALQPLRSRYSWPQ